MKSFLSCIVLISLCSCGRTTKPITHSQTEVSQSVSENLESFILPKLNVSRTTTIDKDVANFYEDMTINSKKGSLVLGDNAFYITINENLFPSYSEIHLNFYNKTKVQNIFYVDSQNPSLPLAEINKENLTKLGLKEVTEFFRDGLSWGKHNLDNPENDMLNKAYVIRTEEMKSKNNVEYKSQSMYLIWFECLGSVKAINEHVYSCGKYNLKLHYKLLDYSLTTNKI